MDSSTKRIYADESNNTMQRTNSSGVNPLWFDILETSFIALQQNGWMTSRNELNYPWAWQSVLITWHASAHRPLSVRLNGPSYTLGAPWTLSWMKVNSNYPLLPPPPKNGSLKKEEKPNIPGACIRSLTCWWWWWGLAWRLLLWRRLQNKERHFHTASKHSVGLRSQGRREHCTVILK